MSYILQALARSERERRQLEARDLGEALEAGVTRTESDQRRIWLLGVGSVAAIVLTAAWIVLGNGHDTPEAADRQSANRSAPPAPVTAETTQPRGSAAAVKAEGSPVTVAPLHPGDKRQVASAPLHQVAVSASTERARTRAPIVDTPSVPASRPTEAPQRVQSLPGIDVTIHVYSEDPRRRFVYVNGKRYGEGERIDQMTARVQGITRDGLIIDLGNRTALLEVRQ